MRPVTLPLLLVSVCMLNKMPGLLGGAADLCGQGGWAGIALMGLVGIAQGAVPDPFSVACYSGYFRLNSLKLRTVVTSWPFGLCFGLLCCYIEHRNGR